MIFFHKPYYNLNYTNPNKINKFSDVCPKPQKLYKIYKLHNAKNNYF